MKAITLRAHFNGDHIQLDQPFALEPGTPLAVTIMPEAAAELAWSALSAAGLEGCLRRVGARVPAGPDQRAEPRL